MIRRPETTADGRQRWVLISQIEHARISGELAERWGSGPFAPLPWRDELLPAIHHHDDGWADWERSPDVDPASGTPRDFTEMPLEEALDIWRGSIASAERFGPLAAYVVSGHFAALLRRAAEAKPQPTDWSRRAADYLAEQDALQARWLAEWASGGAGRDPTAARAALGWLQLFDALSLWLCCRERTTSYEVHPPAGPPVTFTPRDAATIGVAPWPFAADRLALQVPGRSIPQAHYADRAALAGATSTAVTVRWTLLPGT